MVKPLIWKTFELFLSKPLHLGKTIITFGLHELMPLFMPKKLK